MRKYEVSLAIALISLMTSVSKADIKAPCTILKTKRFFDGSKWHNTDTQILVEGDVIASISPNLSKSHKHCQQINLKQAAVTPGLIDTHTHVFIDDTNYGNDFSQVALAHALLKPEARLKTARENAKALLYSGFTSIRDLGNSGPFLDTQLKQEQIDTPSKPLPRIFASGPGWAMKRGQLPASTENSSAIKEYASISPDIQKQDVDRLVQEYKSKNVDTLKLYADNDPEKGELPLATLKKIVEAAQKVNLPVAIHASTLTTSRAAVLSGTHSLEHGFEVDEPLLKQMNQRQSFLVPTGIDQSTCLTIQSHNADPEYKSCKKYLENFSGRLMATHQAQVQIAFGSDMYMVFKKGDRGTNSLSSLFSYTEGGLSPNDTLRSATSTAAKLLRKEDLGVIKAGAQADIVAFNGDPEKDIRALKNISFVMKSGYVFCRSEKSCKK